MHEIHGRVADVGTARRYHRLEPEALLPLAWATPAVDENNAGDERRVELLAYLPNEYADVGYRFFTVSADGEVRAVPKPIF